MMPGTACPDGEGAEEAAAVMGPEDTITMMSPHAIRGTAGPMDPIAPITITVLPANDTENVLSFDQIIRPVDVMAMFVSSMLYVSWTFFCLNENFLMSMVW
jgi:hypothetical protein